MAQLLALIDYGFEELRPRQEVDDARSQNTEVRGMGREQGR